MAALIKKRTGLTVEEIRRMPLEEVHAAIEAKIGHKLSLELEPGCISSGDVLIDMGRVITSEEIERAVDKI
ncbi:MAG: hypothetical protein Q8Q90_00945 [bacterium]|nr:hypothetical protein [bacterium]